MEEGSPVQSAYCAPKDLVELTLVQASSCSKNGDDSLGIEQQSKSSSAYVHFVCISSCQTYLVEERHPIEHFKGHLLALPLLLAIESARGYLKETIKVHEGKRDVDLTDPMEEGSIAVQLGI